jgi:very-short-patch-repair endonuclease
MISKLELRSQLLESGFIESEKFNSIKVRWYSGELIRELSDYYQSYTGNNPSSVSEAAYFCYYNMTAYNKCFCGKEITKYMSFKKGYREYCSVKCAKSSVKVLEQTRQTNIKKYGVTNVSQSVLVKNKREATFIKRYGVKSYYQSIDFKNKAKETLIKRYGVDHPMRDNEIASKCRSSFANTTIQNLDYSGLILRDKKELQAFLANSNVIAVSAKLGVCQQTVYAYAKQHNLLLHRSSYEEEIASWLRQNGIPFNINTKVNGFEADFILNENNIVIEFNGLYYHSLEVLSLRTLDAKNYHKKKWSAFSEMNYKIIMINEDEWLRNSLAIKNKILHLCGLSERGVGARKLKIGKVDNVHAHEFVDLYHIQGRTGTVIASYGAFYEGIMVAVIQFNKQRGTNDIELIRFCSDGKSYPGVFSRLFHHAVMLEGYSKVISFADLRYSDGDLYEKNGFLRTYITKPDYRYVKGVQTFHKSSFTKTQIAKKFNIDVSNITEKEAMTQLKYNKIYDCGKIRYIWKRNFENDF